MSRHRAQDPDETSVIPRIMDQPPSPDEPPSPVEGTEPVVLKRQPDPVPADPAPPADLAPPAVPLRVSPAPVSAWADLTPISPAPVPPVAPVPPGVPVQRNVPVPDDATAIIPRIPAAPPAADPVTAVSVPLQSLDPDATTTIPRVPVDDASTMLIGIVPPPPVDGTADGPRKPRPGDPPVRAVRTKEGDYLSAHSDFTRVTLGSIIRATLRTTGEIMITCGLVILLFAGYEIWGKSAIVDAHQADLDQQLAQEWDRPLPEPSASNPTTTKPLPPPPGNALGRLYIPRLNKHWVITQGVTPADIRYSPGHYPNSAMPGQPGNFSLAGHRMRSVFWDLDKLQTGDKLIVETRGTWYVYAVVKSRIVKPSQIEVVSSKPPGLTPGKLITLTTCNPKWDNYQRLIIHGSLIGQQSRADGPPEGVVGA